MTLLEVHLDGFIGPTHHLGGLGIGNIASQSHRGWIAHPRAAALQGLDKIDRVARLGLPQFILPPQSRPNFRFLRAIGFAGDCKQIWESVAKSAPHLLSVACSASSMWSANAATVTPSCDASDGKVHLTIANLLSSLHRSHEPQQTTETLRLLFSDSKLFTLHEALPAAWSLRDEGAANHMRLGKPIAGPGIHLFVYGTDETRTTRFYPRQSREAFEAIARHHRLTPAHVFLWKQHQEAIEAGAFHNDVVAMSYGNVLLHHELAFDVPTSEYDRLEQVYESCTSEALERIQISSRELPLRDAVESYLFNSQLLPMVNDPHGSMQMICPKQCQENQAATKVIDRLLKTSNRIRHVEFVELRESMHNGGGPACLRLRVPLTPSELAKLPDWGRWSETRSRRLREVVSETYPEEQSLEDLRDISRLERWQYAETAVREALGWPPSNCMG